MKAFLNNKKLLVAGYWSIEFFVLTISMLWDGAQDLAILPIAVLLGLLFSIIGFYWGNTHIRILSSQYCVVFSVLTALGAVFISFFSWFSLGPGTDFTRLILYTIFFMGGAITNIIVSIYTLKKLFNKQL